MKKSLIFAILSIVVACGVLLGLRLGLESTASKNVEKEQQRIFRLLCPGSTEFTEDPYTGDDATVSRVYKGQTGFVVETVTQGYADEITLWVGVSTDGKVTGLTVKELHETCGLGQTALNDHEFLLQFLDTDGTAAVGEGVDAISGATVTSKAIARCVTSAVAVVTGADVDSGATSWGG